MWSSEIKKAAEIIAEARHVVSFCGAGISAESGIALPEIVKRLEESI